ncbi:MAG: HAD family hydrolase [Elusimicrobiales bacterium]
MQKKVFNKDIRIILFDIDGTLIKAGGAGMRALNAAIVDMGGKSDVCRYFELQGETDRVNFENAFFYAFGRKPSKKEFKKISSLYIKHLPGEIERSLKEGKYIKIKGVDSFLTVLSKKENIFIGLATGNLREGAYIKLGPSNLSCYFLFGGFGGQDVKREKMLLKAVKSASKITNCDIKPHQVYVIGDTEKDIIAAKNCGFHSACVLDGFGSYEKIIKAGPELIENDFSNLKVWLMWLGIERDPKGVKRGTYIFPDTPIEHAYCKTTATGIFIDEKDFEKAIDVIREKKKV